MLTCKSPWKVMRTAYQLARQCLPTYSNKFSRKDFTLPQLFACLVLREHQNKSYRGVEALLQDAPQWCRDIGMPRVPDHNTLCRAAAFLLKKCHVDRLLDQLVRWAALARLLKLSTHPLVIDSTMYESHHVSRHYERRCHKTRWRMKRRQQEKGRKSGRSGTVKRLPKLAIAAASASHFVVSCWCGTGGGADQPHFRPLLSQARKRIPNRRFKVAADGGYDSEDHHQWVREELGLVSLIPPDTGRPPKQGQFPGGRWRRHMHKLLATKQSRQRCGYSLRSQDETVNSMMKRNLGSALRGKTAWSRKRDMALKTLTHNVMVLH